MIVPTKHSHRRPAAIRPGGHAIPYRRLLRRETKTTAIDLSRLYAKLNDITIRR